MKLDKEIMIRSYNNISFSPERRGEQDFLYYSELLKTDLETLGENKGNYEQKFIDRIMLFYHRQSRCASSFICGPSNFPVRSNRKKIDSTDRALNDFNHWRNKYFKAVNRERTLSPEEEIDKTLKEIDYLEDKKELYKECNKLKTFDERVKFLSENNLTEKLAFYMRQENAMIPTYAITSLTTKIRERRKKLEVMRVRIERKETFETINFEGGEIKIENDRVIIQHLSKPERDVIEKLKSHGFRWSPSFKAWSRKHTGNAIYDAKNIVGIK
jgi:hypothetical protein